MATAAQLRKQIESELAGRIPAALSPPPLRSPEPISCGVAEVDALLGGGLLLGSIVELTGAPSSGRATLALSTLAGLTRRGHCCAYVDACDMLDPLSAAAVGLELRRLLWVRPPTGGSPPPASFPHLPKEGRYGAPSIPHLANNASPSPPPLRWGGRTDPALRLDRALRATDLLLNAGGWSGVVLDRGDLPPEQARRVPLATWYRFRLQAEKSRALLLLLTPMACATSCASISLQSEETEAEWRRAAENGPALLAELHYRVSVARDPRQICSWLGVERSRVASLPPKKPAASEQTWWTRTLSWPG